jgi:predicted dehydrogenase
MKSLVVGMGIGQLYKAVLLELGHTVVTVDHDINRGADYVSYELAFIEQGPFDTVHICTPNFTHMELALYAGEMRSGIVFVEKPGVQRSEDWLNMCKTYPTTRFMMVKNNQYREEIKQFTDLANQSKVVKICWNNYNRIPSPGSWFTTKELAFGGVSRDLIPHMLSYYCAMTDYTKGNKLYAKAVQRHSLESITDTDYGVVNPDGIYDVDDFCEMEFTNGKTKWILTANWRTQGDATIGISFDMNNSAVKHELGLCPESAYKKMIVKALENLNNKEYWQDQFAQDIWIHRQIENL